MELRCICDLAASRFSELSKSGVLLGFFALRDGCVGLFSLVNDVDTL
jgi:hypothetical protein